MSQMRGMGYYFNINPKIYTTNCAVVYLKRSVMAANDAATNLNSYPKEGLKMGYNLETCLGWRGDL